MLGKFAALLVVFLIPLAVISVYPLIFAQFGDVYLPTSYGSLVAVFLMGAALLAVGVFISSLTDNQGLAAGITIAAILFNYYSVSLSEYVSSTAIGTVIALAVLIFALGAVIRYLTRNELLAYGVCLVLTAVICVIPGRLLFPDGDRNRPGHPDPGQYTGFRAAGIPDTL